MESGLEGHGQRQGLQHVHQLVHDRGRNRGCDSWSRFRDISSRIMWNFPDTDCLKLDYAHGTFNADDASVGNADMKGRDVFGSFLGKDVLFPGSILLRTAR